MIVIIDKSAYEMSKEQAEAVLETVKKAVPCGIYAVKTGNVIELKCKPYKYKQNLRKAVAEYVKKGIKVYYNGG